MNYPVQVWKLDDDYLLVETSEIIIIRSKNAPVILFIYSQLNVKLAKPINPCKAYITNPWLFCISFFLPIVFKWESHHQRSMFKDNNLTEK